jgi:hypothetical protein
LYQGPFGAAAAAAGIEKKKKNNNFEMYITNLS